jgi:hypothetical protein
MMEEIYHFSSKIPSQISCEEEKVDSGWRKQTETHSNHLSNNGMVKAIVVDGFASLRCREF